MTFFIFLILVLNVVTPHFFIWLTRWGLVSYFIYMNIKIINYNLIISLINTEAGRGSLFAAVPAAGISGQ